MGAAHYRIAIFNQNSADVVSRRPALVTTLSTQPDLHAVHISTSGSYAISRLAKIKTKPELIASQTAKIGPTQQKELDTDPVLQRTLHKKITDLEPSKWL